jgi:nitric oxide reductase NorD protein
MAKDRLRAEAIEDQLGEPLEPVLSSRRTATAQAQSLAPLGRTQQEFALHWTGIIAKTNAELAYQFVSQAAEAMSLMSLEDAEEWVVQAMDAYDKKGLFAATAVMKEVRDFASHSKQKSRGISFEEVSGVLEIFVHGLSGRRLKLEPSEETWTDTGTLYLPRRITRFTEREDNYQLYKTIVAHLWAQTRFGTFRRSASGEGLVARLDRFPDPVRASAIFHALETVRLDACIARELPGLARSIAAVQNRAGTIEYDQAWSQALERVREPGVTSEDLLSLVETLWNHDIPDARCYQGILHPGQAEAVMLERVEREKQLLQMALAGMTEDGMFDESTESGSAIPPSAPKHFELRTPGEREQLPEDFLFELRLEGKPMSPPPEVRTLMQSILQDLGDIPPDYLVAGGDGDYDPRASAEKRPEDVWNGSDHGEDTSLYPEWDYRRRHYRKDWCVLREMDVHPDTEPFVQQTLKKYHGELQHLRKSFEALRGENRLMKKQSDGDDVDFDALVEALADLKQGMEMPDRLFTRTHKVERNIAVMFMVDMSGSTKGWINDAERESLVLLCHALEILGDRYAIYGFSGMTRKRCELYRIKRFDETYSEVVQQRITGIKPQDYTRMGVTIRHLSRLLNEVEARTKLLVTLSDGKPDDFDGYRGEYGIEDTRQALIEAKQDGIHSFCITIDTEAREYLPHMYGAVNYTIIDDVRKLPFKVADIYRRLTL